MRALLFMVLVSCAPKHIEIEEEVPFSNYPEIEINIEDLEEFPEAEDVQEDEDEDEEKR